MSSELTKLGHVAGYSVGYPQDEFSRYIDSDVYR